MIRCRCERPLVSDVGDGFVVTVDQERLWMRRRTDVLDCPDCHTSYRLLDLVNLQTVEAREERAGSAE